MNENKCNVKMFTHIRFIDTKQIVLHTVEELQNKLVYCIFILEEN